MDFTGKDRADLRAEAHHLKPIVHIGQHGITPAVVQSLKEALRTKELVKLQTSKNGDVSAKDAASRLSAEVGAEVIQVIGRTLTLFKHNPDIVRRADDLPPWRR